MRTIRLLFVLAVSGSFAGCIVPQLDNYPADKSRGGGTHGPGEDAVYGAPGGGGNGTLGGSGAIPAECVEGTFAGSVTFAGANSTVGYGDQCRVAGTVTVMADATSDQLVQAMRLRSIGATLSLLAPGNLSFPALATVGGAVQISGGSLTQNAIFPALTSVSNITINDTTALVSADFPALLSNVINLTVKNNPLLTSVRVTMPTVSSQIGVTDNPQLQTLSFPSLASVTQLFVMNNPLLSSIVFPAAGTKINGPWMICTSPKLDQAWLAAFRQAHVNGLGQCP